jgi:hypothetical protein
MTYGHIGLALTTITVILWVLIFYAVRAVL